MRVKKVCLIFVVCGIAVFSAVAEQITTVAIIDVGEVFSALPNQAKGYENLNRLKEQYQQEINGQVQKLDQLKREKALALREENFTKAEILEQQITNLANYIDSLSEQRQRDLIAKSKSRTSKEFLEKLQDAISFVAEEKGYTLVLQSTMAGIQWWAPIIDITAEVIKRLKEVN